MKYDELVASVAKLPFFDLALVMQVSGEKKSHVRVQLHRWMKRGLVIHLRRGLYALADRYRRHPLDPMMLANELYRPSYVSGIFALGHYDMIPESVFLVTSVTTRVTREFTNAAGTFAYSKLKQDLFWGFHSEEVIGGRAWLADPEKALLDYWYLTPGEWTVERLREMRYQNFELVGREKLAAYAQRWKSARLSSIAERWQELADAETAAMVEL